MHLLKSCKFDITNRLKVFLLAALFGSNRRRIINKGQIVLFRSFISAKVKYTNYENKGGYELFRIMNYSLFTYGTLAWASLLPSTLAGVEIAVFSQKRIAELLFLSFNHFSVVIKLH